MLIANTALVRSVSYSIRRLFVFLLCFAIPSMAGIAQSTLPSCGGIDTVLSVRWGIGQDFGREFFPQNIYGFPDTNARAEAGSADPRQICSLGLGGEIIIGWKNAVLVNRAGADFTIFENVFLKFDNRPFAEPARIAVSKDGVNFIEFPFDSLTLRGCAGVSPTIGNRQSCDSRVSGGDSFDLATIGMDSIRFIRIRDISAWLLSRTNHPLWDPTISGFDLDAVVGINLLPAPRIVASVRTQTISTQPAHTFRLWTSDNELIIDETSPTGILPTQQPMILEVYSVHGVRLLHHEDVSRASMRYGLQGLSSGMYNAILRVGNTIFRHSFLVTR